jgi:hypothetical protein
MSQEKYIGYLELDIPIPCGLPDYVERRGNRFCKPAPD